jgi:predicted glycoside hydrolase/deacetylase ChbG (UPF0249 family)
LWYKVTMPPEVLFIADDFGLSDEVNEAIVHAHRHGVLSGASLMLGQPATAGAVALARENPELQVGWHLHLNDSTPCSVEEWPWGRSPAAAGLALGRSGAMRGVARREIERQWESFRATGLPCRFVNAHHHIHLHPFVLGALKQTIAGQFDGWLRWGRPRFFATRPLVLGYRILELTLQAPRRRRMPFRTSTTLWGIDRTCSMNSEEVARVLPTLSEGLHEFMFHPRRREDDPDTNCLLELTATG